jgi:hypothetical protein
VRPPSFPDSLSIGAIGRAVRRQNAALIGITLIGIILLAAVLGLLATPESVRMCERHRTPPDHVRCASK